MKEPEQEMEPEKEPEPEKKPELTVTDNKSPAEESTQTTEPAVKENASAPLSSSLNKESPPRPASGPPVQVDGVEMTETPRKKSPSEPPPEPPSSPPSSPATLEKVFYFCLC